MDRNRDLGALRRGLLAGAAALLAALPAWAQERPADCVTDDPRPECAAPEDVAPAPEAGDDSRTVTIVGSRLRRTELIAPVPVKVIGAEAIAFEGVPNIQDVLTEVPGVGAPTFSRTTSNFDIQNSGVATVDLRNLGEDRTLVLVDGLRMVAGVPGSATVDFNTIPTPFIEGVEVITGGASAAYGTDAVAGVVNLRLRRNFEGAEVSTRFGVSDEGDGQEQEYSLLVGSNFAEDRGNAVAYFGYSNQEGVFSRNRDFAAVDQISTAAALTGTGDPFQATRPFFSSFAPQGRFRPRNAAGAIIGGAAAGDITFNPNNTIVSPFSTNGSATRVPNGFNRSEFRTIAIPTERYNFGANVRYEILEDVEAFVTGFYAQTETQSELEPFPFDTGGTTGPFRAQSGIVPIFLGDPATQTTTQRGMFVPANVRAFLPAGTVGLSFTRRLSEFGNRGSFNTRETFRVATGLEGSIDELALDFNVAYIYGSTTQQQTSNGQINNLTFREAVNLEFDPTTPDPDDLRCANPEARRDGCVPVNFFGFNSITPQALRYITADQVRIAKVQLHDVTATISGDSSPVFSLPAGPISYVLGAEYRYEETSAVNDPLTEQGFNAGNANLNYRGDFDVTEFFGEIGIPLVREDFIYDASIEGAYRISNYSTVDRVSNYTVRANVSPIEAITFRGVFATAARAPNAGELFSSAQTFPTGLQDICSGVTATSTRPQDVNCRRDVGIQRRIARDGIFTPTQAELQGISGFNRGNAALGEEEADTYTAGVVLDGRPILPDYLNASLTVDYFNIEIEKGIAGLGRQTIINQCYLTNNPQFCQFITRVQNANDIEVGSIDLIDSVQDNLSEQKTEGVDVGFDARLDLDAIGSPIPGSLDLSVDYTYLIELSSIPVPGAAKDRADGEIGAPEHELLVGLTYTGSGVVEGLRLNVQMQYIDESELDDTFVRGFAAFGGFTDVTVDASYYFDAQASYTLQNTYGGEVEMFVGANNVFDEDPAPIISGLPGNTTGAETAAGVYDPIGRFIYGGVKFRF